MELAKGRTPSPREVAPAALVVIPQEPDGPEDEHHARKDQPEQEQAEELQNAHGC